MNFLWKLLALLLVGSILTTSVCAQSDIEEEEDDDDGIVEDEPEVAPPVVEKKKYEPPKLSGKPHLAEPFDNKANWQKKWTLSEAKKDDVEEDLAKYDGKWSLEEPKESPLEGDLGLILKSKAKHHAVSSKLDKVFKFAENPFIVSYEVKFQNGIDCGGAYIKLLSQDNKVDLKTFHDKTPYTIMFGPDKCGLDYKLHFIFRHKNPRTGEFEEKHAKKPSGSLDKYFTDKKTHLYTLVVNPDNTFEILVDNKVINSGSLLEDMSPPVNPPKEIDDPSDKKPEDWDEREKIPDPDATKPDDWDESQPMEVPDDSAEKPSGWLDDEEPLMPDPDAEKPEDWDDEMDGDWEAPLIDNPNCKSAPGCGEWTRPNMPNPLYRGKWVPPMIENPDYQGEWKPKRIINPNFFEDLEPFKMHPINALGLELWSMTDEIVFDNFLVTDDRAIHESWIEQTFEKKSAAEAASGSGAAFVQGILDVTKDRPWLWAVFLVVIVLPIVLVIAYCCMPKDKLGIWNTLMSSAEERPWLYAVYIVVLLLPIVLLSICLCPRSGPIKQEDLDAARKKTDEASPDDEVAEEAEKPEETPDAGGDNKVTKSKKSKAALEKEEEPETESQEETPEDEEEEKTEATRRSPRKRKTRKE